MLSAPSIIGSHPRIKIASAGSEDLATVLGAVPLPETLRPAKQIVHLAAKGAGRYSFGLYGTIANYSDLDGLRALIAEARLHGFDGATAIHPSVVPLLNEGFMPTEADTRSTPNRAAA